jgi:benzoyl-CoA-dihydrodiol lyase
VTVRLDDIDWDDDTRIADRGALEPLARRADRHGGQPPLRRPRERDSKIFARLTAWQNWIFIRPNATGPEGALSLYGKPQRPASTGNSGLGT